MKRIAECVKSCAALGAISTVMSTQCFLSSDLYSAVFCDLRSCSHRRASTCMRSSCVRRRRNSVCCNLIDSSSAATASVGRFRLPLPVLTSQPAQHWLQLRHAASTLVMPSPPAISHPDSCVALCSDSSSSICKYGVCPASQVWEEAIFRKEGVGGTGLVHHPKRSPTRKRGTRGRSLCWLSDQTRH